MATAATEVTLKHLDIADDDAIEAMRWIRGEHGRPRIHFVDDHVESRTLSEVEHGTLIISASGMCDAGRIKRHLRANLPRPECSIVITGFQAAGTLGRRIGDGNKLVRIYGDDVPVRADIYTIGGLSAHADRDALLDWLSHFSKQPDRTFVVHGELTTAHEFAAAIRERFNWSVEVPRMHTSFEIGNSGSRQRDRKWQTKGGKLQMSPGSDFGRRLRAHNDQRLRRNARNRDLRN